MASAGQSDQGTGRAKVTRDQANFNKNDLIQVLRALRNGVFTVPGLAIGSTTTGILYANTIFYRISGIIYTHAAADNIDISSGLTNTGVGQFCKLRIEIDSGGTVTAKQGGIASNQLLAKFPPRSASKATLGWIEIPASFLFGTTLMNVAGVWMQDGDPDLDALALEA